MNESRDIQHPDITQAEKTGYPWFPRMITVEATEQHAKAYCVGRAEDFFGFMMAAYPYAVLNFLDEEQNDFAEFVLAGGDS